MSYPIWVRYYVVSQDGQRYGPADVPTLNGWITEGRLLPTNMLENETSGERVPASSVAGLNFPPAGPEGQAAPNFAAGQPYQQNYARPSVGDDGSGDLRTAWILAVVGLFCCCICSFVSLSYAKKAEQKGNPGAKAVKIFVYVVLAINVLWIGFNIISAATGKGGFMPSSGGLP